MKPTTDYSLENDLKLHWGATAMPFGKTVHSPFRWPGFDSAMRRLQQAIALRSSGVLTASNGVGKSYLLAECLKSLSDKQYAPLRLHHTSLTGSDLLRSLCFLLGQTPRFRRSDTIERIGQCWSQLDGRFPLLVIDEAQNLNPSALEELRLLGCAQLDARPLFSLILVGDDDLLTRLQLGVNRSLLTRMGFYIALEPVPPEQTPAYVQNRLREVNMPAETFSQAAIQILAQASEGALRSINLLARQAIQNALEEPSTTIEANHVQQAIEQLPWFNPVAAPFGPRT